MTLNFNNIYDRLPDDLKCKLENCMQDPKWHPEGNVRNHIEIVCNNIRDIYNSDPELMVAAIFHDLGKVDTTEIKEKDGHIKITSYGHEFKSLNYVDNYFHLYSDITANKEKIIEIVKYHMYAHLFMNGEIKNKTKIERFKSLKYFEDIIKFSECDKLRN